MSYCELCGSEISGSSFAIVVEDVVMNVCRSCSKHGKPHNVTANKPKKPMEEFRFRFPTVRSDYSKVIKEVEKSLDYHMMNLAVK